MTPKSRTSWRVLAIPAALAAMVWGYGGEDLVWAGVAGVVLSVAFALAPCVSGIARPSGPAARPAWFAPLAVLLGLTAASLAWTADVFAGTLDTAFGVLLVLVLADAQAWSDRERQAVLSGCLAVVTAASLYGFAQRVGLFPCDFWHNGLFASRFVANAGFAAMAAAAVPLGMGLAAAARGRVTAALAVASVPLNVVAVILAQARAVWLVAAVAGCALMAATLFVRVDATARRRLRAALAVAVVAAACAAPAFAGDVAGRIRQLADARGQSVAQRIALWRETTHLVAAHPAGVGAGGFQDTYLAWKRTSDRFSTPHAHNEFLQVAAELGWASAPLLAWLLIAAARAARTAVVGSTDTSRLPALCLCASLAIYALHSLVDFPLRLRANALFFAALFAALVVPRPARLAPWEDEHRKSASPTGVDGTRQMPNRARARVPGWAAALAAAALVAGWAAFTLSAWHFDRAWRALARHALAQALPHLRAAGRWMPLHADAAFERGRVEYTLSALVAPGQRGALLRRAEDALRRSLALAHRRAMTHLWLARLLADTGRAAEAGQHFRAAIACDPRLGRYHFEYASFLLDRGRRAEAVAVFRRALAEFHDDPALGPAAVFARLDRAGSGEAELRAACPDDAASRAALEKFLRNREARTKGAGRAGPAGAPRTNHANPAHLR